MRALYPCEERRMGAVQQACIGVGAGTVSIQNLIGMRAGIVPKLRIFGDKNREVVP